MEQIKKQLITIEEEMATAFNKGDVDNILYYFDQDLIGFSSTIHERLGGLEELRKTFEYYLNQSEKMEVNITSPVVQVFGDTAVVSFYWVVALMSNSNRREINGRGSHFYIKKSDQWKIVHEHFSRAHSA